MIVIHRGKEPSSLLKYRKSSTDACYEELPKEALDYIHFIEEAMGVPIKYVSVGAAREDYIVM